MTRRLGTGVRAGVASAAVALVAGGLGVLSGGGVAHAAGPDPAGTVYVADESTHSIDVFAAGTKSGR